MTNGCSGIIANGPDSCVFDPKSFPRAGDANAAIVTDIALGFNFLEEPIAMDLGKGFGGEARR